MQGRFHVPGSCKARGRPGPRARAIPEELHDVHQTHHHFGFHVLRRAARGGPAPGRGGGAQAQSSATCGVLNNFRATCGDQAFASGILYEDNPGWAQGVITDVRITVTGGAATTITAPPNRSTWREGGIVLRTDGRVGGSRDIELSVAAGTNDGNAVVIQEHSSNGNHGVYLHQDGRGAHDTTATLGSGVMIGTTTARMRNSGVQVLVLSSTNTGVHTITSAATIHSTTAGLEMANRSSGRDVVTNSGTITTAATGGGSGILVSPGAGSELNTRSGSSTTTNSGSITVSNANAHGIYVFATGVALYKAVNSGTITASGAPGHGIYVDARRYKGTTGDGGIQIENSGSGARGITASGAGSFGIYVDATGAMNTGAEDITITNSGDVTSNSHAILVNSDMAAVTVTASAGELESTSGDGIAIQQNADADMTVISGADVTAGMRGIRVQAVPDGTDATTATTGDISITTTGGSIEAESDGMDGIWPEDHAAHTGSVTVSNAASITADRYGIYANRLGSGPGAGMDSVSVTNTGGTVLGKTNSGIFAWNKADDAGDVTVSVTGGTVRSMGKSTAAISAGNRGTGSVTVTIGAEGDAEAPTLNSMYNAGVYADLIAAGNTAGKIAITQGGTIAARKGVYARVGRASASDETRAAAAQPVIDVTWSGTFSHGTAATVSQDDMGRYVAVATSEKSAAQRAIDFHQEVETEKAIRYGSPAGIEAQVMSWRDVMEAVAVGDAPAAVAADNAAQLLLVPNGATAADNDYVAAFKAALTNPDIEVPAAVLTAIGSTATTAAGVTDAEIVTYLQGDTNNRRTLLRNVLAQSLSDEEKAVLRAVVTNTGLDAALDDADAAFSDAYKMAVKALLERRNIGNIRVNMTGGSIASRGDGIRAYYATPHDMNGAISVTVAAGATVTGGNAGIYVANAGEGLMLARKYTYGYAMGDDPDELVAVMHGEGADAVPLLDQLVTVAGMVTGGTDAAVHLSGGGAVLVMEGGRVHAGASGVGILVNDPGPALIYVDGEVRGGAGGTAAVHLTGGGAVIVGLNGRVLANGAAHAIRSDGEEEATLTLATSRMIPYREDVEDQVEGSVEGLGNNVRYREYRNGVPTGYSGTLPVGDNGMVDVSGLPRRPTPPADPTPPTDSTGDGVRVDTGEDATVSRDDGIRVSYEDPGDDNEAIRVEVRKGERVTGSMAGIYVANAGPGLMLARRYTPGFSKGDDPDEVVAVMHGEGADAVPLRNQLVTVAGTVTGGADAAVHLDGGGAVLVMEGGRVHAGASGEGILVNDPGPALIYVDGEVKGVAGGDAAVHLTGGGAVIVGLNGRVQANGADHAIRSDGSEATTLILVVDRMDPYREDVNAQMEGSIEGIESARLREDRNGVPTGYSRSLQVDGNGMLDVSGLPSRFSCEEAGDRRCRMYEALPSMLVAMNDLPSYAERMSAARDGNGGWARVETARGDWQAKKATTSGKLAYDYHRNAGRVGVDYVVREDVRIGASAHALRGKAEMAGVGEVDVDGMGVGVSATWMAGDLHVDAQAAATWYDADFESNAFGRLKKDASGKGVALGVDVGQRMAMGSMAMGEEMFVTPRAGFVWSKADLDDFMDDYMGMETGDSPGQTRASVAVEDAVSVKGRLGVMVETEAGMGATSGRLFGSLDVEREFSDETEVKVGGQMLKTEVRPTTVRLGLGGVFDVDENILVRATAGYRTSGSGTSGYGGGLELHVRF